jgi:hypothetical protein
MAMMTPPIEAMVTTLEPRLLWPSRAAEECRKWHTSRRDVQQILVATDQPGQAHPNLLSATRLCSEGIRDGLDRLRNGGFRRELGQQLGNDRMIRFVVTVRSVQWPV